MAMDETAQQTDPRTCSRRQKTRASSRKVPSRGLHRLGMTLVIAGALICSALPGVVGAVGEVVDNPPSNEVPLAQRRGTQEVRAIGEGSSTPCPEESGEPRVALVIDQGVFNDPQGGPRNWPGLTWECISPIMDSSNSFMRGTEVLLANNHELRWHPNGLLCAIDGYPADGCAHETSYWSYWLHLPEEDSTWRYSDRGPAFHRVADEMVMGWRYISLDLDDLAPPRIDPNWDVLCCSTLLGESNAPSQIKATPTQDGVMLEWDAPVLEDGVDIRSYIVSVLPEDELVFETNGATTTLEITDLMIGAVHSFQVRAVTNRGETPPSPLSIPVEIGSGATTSTTTTSTTSTTTTTTTVPDSHTPPVKHDVWEEATWARDWLIRELDTHGHALPSFTPDSQDWGLTFDALLALAALEVTDNATVQESYKNALDNLDRYTTWNFIEGDFDGVLLAGPLAKALLTAAAFGESPSDLRGHDYESELRNLMRDTSPQRGRFSDRNPHSIDNSNMFGQSLAMMALAYTDDGVPSDSVGFVVDQQCPDGGFRLFFVETATCEDDTSDPDATAMALQALAVVSQTPQVEEALSHGVGYLLSHRDPATGGFGGTGPTAGVNGNSSGLIAQALRGLGHVSIADQAGEWIVDELQIHGDQAQGAMQAFESTTGISLQATRHEEAGAIAYQPAARIDALANGIGEFARDQWRRTTAQAVFAMGLPMYSGIGVDRQVGTVTPTYPQEIIDDLDPGSPNLPAAEGQTLRAPSLRVHSPSGQDFKPDVRGTSEQLAWTGSDAAWTLLIGCGLMAIGGVMIRRRPATSSQ